MREMSAQRRDALAVPRPHTTDFGRKGSTSWTEVSLDIGVRPSSRPGTSQGLARPSTSMSTGKKLGRKTISLEPYVSPPRRINVKERYEKKGGLVPSTTCITWDWRQKGPYLTSLVLQSPRAPDFSIGTRFRS